jgi:hypothetical protein
MTIEEMYQKIIDHVTADEQPPSPQELQKFVEDMGFKLIQKWGYGI